MFLSKIFWNRFLMSNVYEKIMMTIFKIGDIFNRSDVVDNLSSVSPTSLWPTDHSCSNMNKLSECQLHHFITVPTPMISHFEKLSPTCISKSAMNHCPWCWWSSMRIFKFLLCGIFCLNSTISAKFINKCLT